VNDWVADWDDVLRRAGRPRYRSRRAAAGAAAVTVAVILLMPGIGIGGGLDALIAGSNRHGLEFRTRLWTGGQAIGSVSIRTVRAVVSVSPHSGGTKPYVPQGVARAVFQWSLQVSDGVAVRSLQILRHGRVAVRLCAPCSDGSNGTFLADRVAFGAVFGGNTVLAATNRGPARGRLKLTRPTR
jgi:hypothetical protein